MQVISFFLLVKKNVLPNILYFRLLYGRRLVVTTKHYMNHSTTILQVRSVLLLHVKSLFVCPVFIIILSSRDTLIAY